MTSDTNDQRDPDLTAGVTLDDFGDQTVLRGHVGEEPVLLARLGPDLVAVSATCTHYGGPLDEGLVVGETVRCPWHHACFSLRTGRALGAPAFDPVSSWRVDQDGDRIVVRERATHAADQIEESGRGQDRPENVLIVGGGAAGFACAEMLRAREFGGRVTIVSADADAPYDRPQLSKQFLAGGASADDLPLASQGYYRDRGIDLRLNTEIASLDLDARTAVDAAGQSYDYDCLVLATGAEPGSPSIPGADLDHVYTLRTVADSRSIIDRAEVAKTAVVMGSGFIGLEVGASLSKKGVEVHVVTRDRLPLEKVLGEQLARRILDDHESHGTTFHTESTLERIARGSVILDDGTELQADMVVLGAGVAPRVDLAEAAGLEVDDGVVVDECLRAGPPGVYAAGDIARWRDRQSGRDLRVEHWVLAQRHGQHVARNILGGDTPFTDVPFFWSAHHDVKIRYVGHAEDTGDTGIDGDVDADCAVTYREGGQVRAVATIDRDVDSLSWEAALEQRTS